MGPDRAFLPVHPRRPDPLHRPAGRRRCHPLPSPLRLRVTLPARGFPPPRSTVRRYFDEWRRAGVLDAIHDAVRRKVHAAERPHSPRNTASVDSQSVDTTCGGEQRGRDNAKDVDGRKRHIVFDSMGLPLAVLVTAADIDDAAAAPDPEEPDTRADDLGQVDDRGFLDAVGEEPIVALGAGGLGDRDLDGRLGERLGVGCPATLEGPLPGLAAGRLGVLDARPLGERSRLPLARAPEVLDLGAELPHQGDQGIAIQGRQVRFVHDDQP